MTSYVALLRAINITGRTIKMDRLRALFAELGLANVATFIASGNVLFDADGAAEALETRIEAHLQDALGYEVATFPVSYTHLDVYKRQALTTAGVIDLVAAFGQPPGHFVMPSVKYDRREESLRYRADISPAVAPSPEQFGQMVGMLVRLAAINAQVNACLLYTSRCV